MSVEKEYFPHATPHFSHGPLHTSPSQHRHSGRSQGKSEEMHHSIDEILQLHSIGDLRQLIGELSHEADSKQSELQLMVIETRQDSHLIIPSPRSPHSRKMAYH